MAGLLAWASLMPSHYAFGGTVAENSTKRMRRRNWKMRQLIDHSRLTIHHPYSYGDSSGLSPDSLFIPMFKSGTKSLQMYGEKFCKQEELLT
jgi:hypothetical protein